MNKENRPTNLPSAATAAGGDKAATSRIARPASRQSNLGGDAPFKPVPPPGPATRSRIGAQTRATAASAIPRTNRPSSVLGNRPPSSLSSGPKPSSIPAAPMRRPSVATAPTGSAASSATAQAQDERARQLEAELATANETISSLQNSLAEADINASYLSSTLRSTQQELEQRAEELAQARTDAEVAHDELSEARHEHAAEIAAFTQQAKEERSAFAAREKELEARCVALEGERDDLAGTREDLKRLLEEAKVEATDYAELEAERDELGTELAWHEEQLREVEEARQVDQETIETLRAELEDADNVIGELEKVNEQLSSRSEALGAKVAELETALEEKRRAGPLEEARRVQEAQEVQEAEAKMAERLSSLRTELAAQVSEVEQERDALIAALADASKAHREAENRLEQARRDREEAVARAQATDADKQNALEELSALRLQYHGANARFIAAVDEKDDAFAEEADPTSAELSTLNVPVMELRDLRVRIADLEEELARSEKLVDKLEEQLEERTDPTDATVGMSGTTAQRDFEEALYDRDEAERELKLAEERIAELEAELEAASGPNEREVVDEAAQQRVLEAEARCEALQREVEQLQYQALTAASDEEDSEQLATLRAELDAERTLTTDAKRESAAVEEALMDAKKQLIELETKLAACEARIHDLEAQHAFDQSRIARVDELENTLQHTEEQLEAVTYELDDLRAQHDDLAQSALQDAAERQAQSDEHDELLELYNRRALETDSLRKILAETEAHADSLAWQLREKESQASSVEQAHIKERDHLLGRIAEAEDEQDRLRTELDEAKHRLSDAQDALDQQVAADTSSTSVSIEDASLPRAAPASPSPPSPNNGNSSFSLSPSADPVALLLRLREERDELRDRLDFARNEAKHRTDDLQDRLRRLEETRAQDISVLQLDLMEKQASYETEREMNVKLEQAVRDAKQHREELSEAAENASRRLREAEARVQDLTSELAESERRHRAAQRGEEEVSHLQTTLADAQQAMEAAQAEAAIAQSQSEQLRALVDSAEQERDSAVRAVAEREEAINFLESRLAELRAENAIGPARDPLVDLASLCDALPSEDERSRSRISELESTLRQYESRIALLQLNLAMRVAIEDDDGDADDVSVSQDADATFVAEATDEIVIIRQQLATTSLERDALFTRLHATLDELDAAVQQREQLVSQNLRLEQDLGAANATASARADELALSRADVKELAQRATTYADEVVAVQTRASQIERVTEASKRRIEDLERELADVVQLRVDYEAKAQVARAQAEEAESAVSRSEQDMQHLANDLAAAAQALQDTRNELGALQATHADGETRSAALIQEAAARADRMMNELDEVRRIRDEREIQLDQLQHRVDDLERELSHTVQQLKSADQRTTSAEQRIAKLDSELELSARENQTLRRLGQSSVAEAEALAAEVTGLKHELQQAHAAKQAELHAAREEATRNLTEVITELEKRERGQLAAENHARQLEAELEHARSASQGQSPKDQARIAELEKVLDARMLDVEEADEKLIEALKVQKKSAATVERLKAKIATLQRDLAVAKSTQAAVVVAAAPLPDTASTPSAGKKRPAPTEFDNKTFSHPRAIAQAPPRALDKENVETGSARKQQRPLSAVKPASLDKGVPLSSHGPRRDALTHVDENAGAKPGRPADAPPPADKLAALTARMQNFHRPKSADIV